ncbi:MAG: type II toxin-antitoxin system VapC family toxin [bacterium]|nr:type II toxin-antitoxin system VapC family toxin [bacterium]
MILLDTHVLVRSVMDSDRLGEEFKSMLGSSWVEGSVAVSSIVFWEIAMLQGRGRLGRVPPSRSLRNKLRVNGLNILPVDDEVAIRAAELGDQGFHPDPADRFITATAIIGGFHLATADRKIIEWADGFRGLSVLDPQR